MIKCAIYARVSTDEQAAKDYNSIDSQIDICKHYIETQREQEWKFAKAYTDPGISGKNLERPGIQELLEDVKMGRINVVLVYKIERLVRSMKDFYKLWDVFEQHNVAFVAATQHFDSSNAMGKLMLNILLSFAQFERENVSEKTKDKMKARAQLGKWSGGWKPYGYDYNEDKKLLVMNKKEAPVIKQSFKMFVEGKKPSEIANHFNAKGYRTKVRTITTKAGKQKKMGGNRFNEDSIKGYIRNPLYKGYVQYQNQPYKGEHKGLVTEALWERANKLLSPIIPQERTYKKDSHVHLLKGILKCHECDVSMTPAPAGKRDKHGNPYLYYICGKHDDIGKDSGCNIGRLPARKFEKLIMAILSDLGKNKKIIESTIKNSSQYNKKRIKPLELERDKTDRKLVSTVEKIQRLVKIMANEDLVSKEVTEEYKVLLRERQALEVEKEKILIDIERCKQDMLDADLIVKTLQSFDKTVQHLPIEEQKELFNLLVKEVRVAPFDPDKEKAPPKNDGALISKIRTKWYKIYLNLYQFPDISSYYRELTRKKKSSDFPLYWLPGMLSRRIASW